MGSRRGWPYPPKMGNPFFCISAGVQNPSIFHQWNIRTRVRTHVRTYIYTPARAYARAHTPAIQVSRTQAQARVHRHSIPPAHPHTGDRGHLYPRTGARRQFGHHSTLRTPISTSERPFFTQKPIPADPTPNMASKSQPPYFDGALRTTLWPYSGDSDFLIISQPV